jgi:hypothetical protein
VTDAFTENQERYNRKVQELIDERNELRAAAPIELGRIAAALERVAAAAELLASVIARPTFTVTNPTVADGQKIRDAIDAASKVYGTPL